MSHSFVRFLGVGVINTIVGTAVMFLCYNAFGFSYWVSSALNYIIGSIVSFYLNRKYTFRYQKRDMWTAVRFVIGIVLCYLIAYGVAKPLAVRLLSGYSLSVQENVAMVFGTVFFVLINYATQRWFTFRTTKEA
ncbi:MAG: GtrA family protein [Actinomycetaceae bacterium]|nr:GtrA family protein [Actinomycetaceae bacterium]